MRSTCMDARELQIENDRLKKELEQAKAQHEATTQQFALSLEEKDRQVTSLERQIELLLKRIRGSRQEYIDPDQLLLFSVENVF
jgi:hypothetical protein